MIKILYIFIMFIFTSFNVTASYALDGEYIKTCKEKPSEECRAWFLGRFNNNLELLENFEKFDTKTFFEWMYLTKKINFPDNYSKNHHAYIYGYLLSSIDFCLKGEYIDGLSKDKCLDFLVCEVNAHIMANKDAPNIKERNTTTKLNVVEKDLLMKCIAESKKD